MSKRGETRPWRVAFEWSNGVKGVDTYSRKDEADMNADRIRDYSAMLDDPDRTVTVTVTDRRASR